MGDCRDCFVRSAEVGEDIEIFGACCQAIELEYQLGIDNQTPPREKLISGGISPPVDSADQAGDVGFELLSLAFGQCIVDRADRCGDHRAYAGRLLGQSAILDPGDRLQDAGSAGGSGSSKLEAP